MQDVICTNTVIWLDSFWIVKKKTQNQTQTKILIVNLLISHTQNLFILEVRFHH